MIGNEGDEQIETSCYILPEDVSTAAWCASWNWLSWRLLGIGQGPP